MTELDQTLVVKDTRRVAFYLQEVLFLSWKGWLIFFFKLFFPQEVIFLKAELIASAGLYCRLMMQII